MTTERDKILQAGAAGAVSELKAVISARFPEATFALGHSEDDPAAIHLYTTVDVEDTDEVVDLVIDRVLDFQLERSIPIHVIPLRPMSRAVRELRGRVPRSALASRRIVGVPQTGAGPS